MKAEPFSASRTALVAIAATGPAPSAWYAET
jgi:hypothetical protein